MTNHDQDIVFLRKIIPGGADQSYGIDVARLAGVPKPVIDRAKEIAAELSDADILAKARTLDVDAEMQQESIHFEEAEGKKQEKAGVDAEDISGEGAHIPAKLQEAMHYLEQLDINHMTPLDAMNTLYELKERFHLS